jgi:hypothetical protein
MRLRPNALFGICVDGNYACSARLEKRRVCALAPKATQMTDKAFKV